MATYSELFDLAYTATATITPLLKKVTVAVSVAATAILSEDVGTTNHANRLAWAKNALRDVQAFGQQMLWSVLQDAAITNVGDAALDADVQTAVNGLVNRYAVGL